MECTVQPIRFSSTYFNFTIIRLLIMLQQH